MWCPKCKQTRPQEPEKRQFSRRALAVCLGIAFVWALIAVLVIAFGVRDDGFILIGGGSALIFVFLAVGGAHYHMTDVLAQYRCPECDAILAYGRPSEEARLLIDLQGELEQAKIAQREAEQKAKDLASELNRRSTNEAPRCPRCDSLVGPNAAYCGRCGHDLEKPI